MKSGEGFRGWTRDEADALRASVFAYLKNFNSTPDDRVA
jgi:hypothetical protein